MVKRWDQGCFPYQTLVLHFLCGPPDDVNMGRRQADGRVHRDVLGGAIRCKDPHVGLIKDRGQLESARLDFYRKTPSDSRQPFSPR